MAFNIKDMVTTLTKNGVMHTNKFLVLITPPSALTNIFVNGTSPNDTAALLQIRAEQAKLPGVLLQSSDVNRYGIGPNQKMPYNVQFTDTNLTFIADKNGDIYRFFYTWMNAVFDFGGINSANALPNYAAGYKDDYSTDLIIYVFDNFGNVKQTVSLFKAFPISFNEVSLGWVNQNELMKFSINFTFRDWKLNDVNISTNLPKTTQTIINSPVLSATLGQNEVSTLGQNELNPLTGKFNGINGTGSETPTFLPGS
jgi:hypothetical protein